jgi:hypothetical protein
LQPRSYLLHLNGIKNIAQTENWKQSDIQISGIASKYRVFELILERGAKGG